VPYGAQLASIPGQTANIGIRLEPRSVEKIDGGRAQEKAPWSRGFRFPPEARCPDGTEWRTRFASDNALLLFRRLGVDVPSLSAREFNLAYFQLAKRYHPDQGNRSNYELMANINVARETIRKAQAGHH